SGFSSKSSQSRSLWGSCVSHGFQVPVVNVTLRRDDGLHPCVTAIKGALFLRLYAPRVWHRQKTGIPLPGGHGVPDHRRYCPGRVAGGFELATRGIRLPGKALAGGSRDLGVTTWAARDANSVWPLIPSKREAALGAYPMLTRLSVQVTPSI